MAAQATSGPGNVLTELTLQVLGAFRVRMPRAPKFALPPARAAPCSPTWRCAQANLTAATGSRHLLWEDADEELARTSLRQALAALRKVIARRCAQGVARRHRIRRHRSRDREQRPARVPARAHAGTRTSLQEAIDHYRGDLLDGFDARSTAFDEWLSSERMHVAQAIERRAATGSPSCACANEDSEGALDRIDASWCRSSR